MKSLTPSEKHPDRQLGLPFTIVGAKSWLEASKAYKAGTEMLPYIPKGKYGKRNAKVYIYEISPWVKYIVWRTKTDNRVLVCYN